MRYAYLIDKCSLRASQTCHKDCLLYHEGLTTFFKRDCVRSGTENVSRETWTLGAPSLLVNLREADKSAVAAINQALRFTRKDVDPDFPAC